MTHPAPVLLVGGAGLVGRTAARTFRALHPEVTLAIAGRDLAKARTVADTVAPADAVRVDLARRDLGLPHDAPFGAIAVFLRDDTLNTLRFAQDRDIPYLSLSTGSFELAPEVALHQQRPDRSAVLLQSHWLGGAASLPALAAARAFARVDAIRIGAVLDPEDMGGPAADADYERLTGAAPHAFVRQDGAWRWATGDAGTRTFRTVDGAAVTGATYAPFDTLSLAAATGARDVRFDLVVGDSASRRRGEPFSTELVVELDGVRADGMRATDRIELVHPQGQAPLTALFVALGLERLLGLDGAPPPPPGLHLPDTLLSPDTALRHLRAIGATVHTT